MKFAIVEGARQEAQPGRLGTCPSCDLPMVAKCGSVKVWHWSHVGRRICDTWWENETEWHRAWKAHFPVEWQEVICPALDGERHIADVQTLKGWTLEFQHSFLHPTERAARNAFYPKLAWVVDATRRVRDRSQFEAALARAPRAHPQMPLWRISTADCALLRDWSGGPAAVFFDFGATKTGIQFDLWCLIPSQLAEGMAYVGLFSRAKFLEMHVASAGEDAFGQLMETLKELVAVEYELSFGRTTPPAPIPLPRMRVQSFQGYLARQARGRRRF